MVRRYYKYLRKRKNLVLANKNERRQAILARHIERLHEQLISLKLIIQKGTIAATVAFGALAFAPQVVDAQNFGAPQINPFGLTQVGYGDSKPIFVDLDGDGDLDVMSGEGYSNGNFNYYENTGTNTAPVFDPLQTNPFGITGMGYGYGTPTFVDIDGDGDLDMMVGFGYDYNYSTGTYNYGGFVYYENTGTSTLPAFAAPILNPFGLTEVGGYGYSAPTFADIDGDGDMDMISGMNGYYDYSTYTYSSGGFKYYENTGTTAAPAFAAPITNAFGLTDVGYSKSTPHLVDIDGDGDFDLISGASSVYNNFPNNVGGFAYYENTGTTTGPAFAAKVTNPFGLTDPSNPGRNTAPTVADLNNDGDLDLLTGIRNGDLIYYPGCSPTTATISPTVACSYAAPSGNILTSTNTYMDTIPNASGCDSIITINLTVNPIANQTISSTTLVACDNGSATIDLTSQAGISYYLRDNTNDTIVDGPLAGTGNGISLNTGPVSSAMTYNVYGEGSTPSKALNFDDVDDYVDAGTGINLANNSFTIEFWAKKSAGSTGDDHIIGLGENTTTNNALHVGFRGNNNFTFAFFGNDLDVSASFTNSNWNHWAVTFDAITKERRIYQNGTLVANDLSSSNFLGTGNLKIGRAYNANNNIFNGELDEVRIWNVARTTSEISANMNICLTGTETGLAAYYQFEDGAGSSTLTDLTANGNNGTLINMNPVNDWVAGSTVCSTCNMEMTQIITVNVGQATASTISPTACISYTSPSGNVWTTSNTYMDTIPNVSGCDSVMTINLTINSVDTSTSIAGFVITSNETGSGATYRWLDCNNSNAIISGQTNVNYTASVNGDYAVEVTVNGCVDTSACVNMVVTNVVDFNLSNVNIYPNPMRNQFTIDLGALINNTQLTVVSIEGKMIYNDVAVKSSKVTLDASDWSKGVYFVRIQNEKTFKTVKLIKQ